MDIIEKAAELGRMIRDSRQLERYRNVELAFLNDAKTQMQYELHKELYNKFRQTRDEELAEEIDKKYNELLANPLFKEYIESKYEFEKLISTVNGLINHYVPQEKEISGCGGCSKKSGCGGC